MRSEVPKPKNPTGGALLPSLLLVGLSLGGCAGSQRTSTTATDTEAGHVTEGTAMAEATGAGTAEPPAPPLTADGMAPPLPDRVEAGTIPRGALLEVLGQGIPRFLQRVEVQPFRPAGKFEGWQLTNLFADDPTLQAGSVLQPGDVVLRVNNHSIERPEQFVTVWNSLASQGEITFDIVRGDQPSRVRYLIDDDNLGTTGVPGASFPGARGPVTAAAAR